MAAAVASPSPVDTAEPKDVPAISAETWKDVSLGAFETFRTQEYGVRPVERPADLKFETSPDVAILGGRAIHRSVRISSAGVRAAFSFAAHAYVPRGGASKCPAFVYVYLGQRVDNEKFSPEAEDPSTWSMPVAEIIRRGYAVVAFNNWEVAIDDKDKCFSSGVFAAWGPDAATRRPNDWGAISAWAWGASRVLDWIETQGDIDASRVAVIGHSRGGKTALWAGVTDKRFALACVNDSGCSGAKLNHVELPRSESIKVITKNFPHWFCPKYSSYVDREMSMPFDQHQLVALMAPRAVAIASATEDHWAGQYGEFLGGVFASPAWEASGLKGLVAPDGYPPPGKALLAGHVAYRLRTGKHDLTAEDWGYYMDFADARMGVKAK